MINLKLRLAALLPLMCSLAACGGQAPLHSTSYVQVPQGDLPAPTRADIAGDSREYLIGPFDKLAIDVFGVPDLTREVQADGDGKIAFPLVGTVDAGGKTPAELAAILSSGLRGRYVRNPQVTVNLRETGGRMVTVDGQVAQPGMYPVIGKMTLMRTIAAARGLAEYAKLDDVVVFRTVNGQRMAALYNIAAIRRGLYPDPDIYPSDTVVVGDSPGRRLFKDVLATAPLLTAPVILLTSSRN